MEKDFAADWYRSVKATGERAMLFCVPMFARTPNHVRGLAKEAIALRLPSFLFFFKTPVYKAAGHTISRVRTISAHPVASSSTGAADAASSTSTALMPPRDTDPLSVFLEQ